VGPSCRYSTCSEVNAARQFALTYGATVETESGSLGPGEIADGATTLGIVIALGVLAMSVGLIRSETAQDLRTLTATGASGTTTRMMALRPCHRRDRATARAG
jgi:putative ABC transport system permease protein